MSVIKQNDFNVWLVTKNEHGNRNHKKLCGNESISTNVLNGPIKVVPRRLHQKTVIFRFKRTGKVICVYCNNNLQTMFQLRI